MIKCFVGFDQPFERSDFVQLVTSQALSLEEICFDDSVQGVFSIVGFARVDNRAFDKIVIVRVTEDGWKTFKDVEAHYLQPATLTLSSLSLSYLGRQRNSPSATKSMAKRSGTTTWDKTTQSLQKRTTTMCVMDTACPMCQCTSSQLLLRSSLSGCFVLYIGH